MKSKNQNKSRPKNLAKVYTRKCYTQAMPTATANTTTTTTAITAATKTTAT